jgi:MFS family permease
VNSRRAWLVFGFAAFDYIIAVMQRSSLGVAGVAATDRFHVSAAVLSTLAVIQLIVYAGLQIPVGVILDRVGSKRLIAIGAALMVLGQVTLALAPSIGFAIGGRVLLGAGDAMTFISVLRLLPNWFSGRRRRRSPCNRARRFRRCVTSATTCPVPVRASVSGRTS